MQINCGNCVPHLSPPKSQWAELSLVLVDFSGGCGLFLSQLDEARGLGAVPRPPEVLSFEVHSELFKTLLKLTPSFLKG